MSDIHTDVEKLGAVMEFALEWATVLKKVREAADAAVDLHLTSDEVRTLIQGLRYLRKPADS